MEKRDYKKDLKLFYKPSVKIVEQVDVPQWNFLMIDGKGDPNNSSSFQEATEALFSLSYTLKFMIKKGPLMIDYGVMPLEGLWWADDMQSFTSGQKDDWFWTLMIMQPDLVTEALVAEASEQLAAKKNPSALAEIRFEAFKEGKAAQIMHVGPFSEEGPAIERVHAYIEEQGCNREGKHHEIYLSDIRRAAPEKWKTVIRQPMS